MGEAKKKVSFKQTFRQAVAEFIGMTLFVYIGTGAVISTGEQLTSSGAPTTTRVSRILPIAFAFGISILVQAYSFGSISGGHFNPAVTLCLLVTGDATIVQTLMYWSAQFTGAIMGSLLLWGSVSSLDDHQSDLEEQIVGSPPYSLGANGLNSSLSSGNGFLLEFMGTTVLLVCVLMTAVHKDSLANGVPHLAPLAIGLAVFLSHVVLVPLTGCGINPARTFGPALVNSFAGNNVWDNNAWIYYAGPFTASIVWGFLFNFLAAKTDDEVDASTKDEVVASEQDDLKQDPTSDASDDM